jgi:hypothetical protein
MQMQLTREEYVRWKQQRESDVDALKREREALSAAIHAEIARLRAENDQLRKGSVLPHHYSVCRLY